MFVVQVRQQQPRRLGATVGGFLFGLVIVAVIGFAVIALALLGGWLPALLITLGFNDWRFAWTWLGVIAASLAAIALLLAATRRWLWPRVRRLAWSRSERLLAGLGALLAAALGFVLVPAPIKDTAVQLATGQSPAQRAPLPASDAERRRLSEQVRPGAKAGDAAAQLELGLAALHGSGGESRDVAEAMRWLARSAAQPAGHEARLLLAVNARAAPTPSVGRVLAPADLERWVDALQTLQPSLPQAWQPVALLAAAGFARDAGGGDSIHVAAAARSRAATVLFAHLDEQEARRRPGDIARADEHWRRALAGYAAGGAIFEVQRLRLLDLPERFGAVAEPPPAGPAPPRDAALAGPLSRFAGLVYADAVTERALPGHAELALAAALIAAENAPDPAAILSVNPGRRWVDPFAMGRWLPALRFARGDCLAAFEVADATRQRRRERQVAASLDMSWAMAWTEAGEGCARTAEELRQAAEYRAQVGYLVFEPGELDAARAGVAATVAALR